MQDYLISDGKAVYQELSLIERCQLLEKITELNHCRTVCPDATEHEVLGRFSDEIAKDILIGQQSAELTPLHLISVLDCLVKSNDSASQQHRENWSIIESHMGRSQNFFKQVDDVTLLAMLLDRLI